MMHERADDPEYVESCEEQHKDDRGWGHVTRIQEHQAIHYVIEQRERCANATAPVNSVRKSEPQDRIYQVVVSQPKARRERKEKGGCSCDYCREPSAGHHPLRHRVVNHGAPLTLKFASLWYARDGPQRRGSARFARAGFRVPSASEDAQIRLRAASGAPYHARCARFWR